MDQRNKKFKEILEFLNLERKKEKRTLNIQNVKKNTNRVLFPIKNMYC